MKASNAASASLRVSAIQISCSDRLALGCWLFGSLLRTLAVLCTQQRCSRVVGHSSPSAFQKLSAPSATASSGLSGISCAAGRVNWLGQGHCEALTEQDGELRLGHGPLA